MWNDSRMFDMIMVEEHAMSALNWRTKEKELGNCFGFTWYFTIWSLCIIFISGFLHHISLHPDLLSDRCTYLHGWLSLYRLWEQDTVSCQCLIMRRRYQQCLYWVRITSISTSWLVWWYRLNQSIPFGIVREEIMIRSQPTYNSYPSKNLWNCYFNILYHTSIIAG